MSRTRARSRADVDAETVASILRPHVRHPSWLKYPDALNLPLQVAPLVQHRVWINQLRAAAGSQAFSQRRMEATFALLVRDDWNLSPEQTSDW
eukprot:14248504-Alexandrium_andersonii.AAC.1